jgi:hypothetical protein
MAKLIVELPDEIHGELRKKAAVTHKTLKDIVTGLINEYLYVDDKYPPDKKKTGLCGKWNDERTAEEIVKDIKAHRKWFVKRKN